MAKQDNLIGHTLGQYQILDEIGRGGMATVYKAWQPALRRSVALKVLHSHLTTDREFVQRFQQEAISAANLSHSNIVTIYNVAQEDGYYYIAMEYIEGRSLEQLIAQDGVFPQARMLHILEQVAAALDYAHQQKFIHRDIKPANVLITVEDRAVLTDFGIVKALEGSGVTTSFTVAGTILGTPAYMSPEHVQGQVVDYRTDLYALGIVCYEMLSGQPPFGGTTTVTILYAQVNNPPPDIRQLNPIVPEHVAGALRRMLSKQPEDRFQSAAAFADALKVEAAQKKTRLMPPNSQPPAYPPPAYPLPVGISSQQPVQPSWTPSISPPPVAEDKKRGGLIAGLVAGAVLLVLAILLLVAWKLWIPSTAKELEKAQAASAAGNYTEAETGFGEVLMKEPAHTAANLGMGEALSAQKEYTQSIPYYQAALAADNELANAHAGLAWAYYYTEEYEEAITEFARLIALKPMEAEGCKGKGLSYYALERYEDALEPLKSWTELEPTAPDSYKYLGTCHEKDDNLIKARDVYRQWVKMADQDEDAHLSLGWVLYQLLEYDPAITEFQQVVALNPDRQRAYWGLGASYAKLGNLEESLANYQLAVQVAPEDASAHVRLGWAYISVEDNNNALKAFQSALVLDPDMVDAHHGAGETCRRLDDDERAVTYYEQWVELQPDSVDAVRGLGHVYYELGRYQDAIESFKEAIILDPQLGAAYQGVGAAYAKLDNAEQSLKFYRQWVEVDPQNADVYNAIGWTLYHDDRLDNERLDEAISAFTQAIDINPQHYWSLYGRARSYMLLDNCDQAISDCEAILQFKPEDEEASKLLEKCRP